MGKGGGKAQVSKYIMALHMGVCLWRPGTALLRIDVADRPILTTNVTSNSSPTVDLPELFGGELKEGGVKGRIDILMGKSDQTIVERLAARFYRTTATMPAFRGFLSLFFTASNDADGGFYWGSNNPYLREVSARVRGVPQGLDPLIAMIDLPNDSQGRAQKAANPAHIIYECLRDEQWGMGAPASTINKASFDVAAQTLFDEDFGMSLLWTQQTEIASFIQEIVDHIHAMVYPDPLTGKHTIKLLRNDYLISSLPEINPDNAVMSTFSRKMWGEISNEVTVTFTDPETEKDRTVVAQDLAAISMQGGVVSASKNYYGARSQDLALRLAERDVGMMSAPLATCSVTVERSAEFQDIAPGSVVTLLWPEYDIERIVFRVHQVSRGSSDNDNTFELTLVEDIFGFERSSYLEGEETRWVNPATEPAPITRYAAETAPGYLMARDLGLNSPGSIEYPAAATFLAVGANTPFDTSYLLISNVPTASGGVSQQELGERFFSPSGEFTFALAPEAVTIGPERNGFIGETARANDFILIRGADESESEICLISDITEGAWTLWRGVLDTTPRDWPAGTRFWVISDRVQAMDKTDRVAGEDVEYVLRTRTSKGLLPLGDATPFTVTLSDRPHLPNRPANVAVNGNGFGPYDAIGVTTFNITWARRNRTVEAVQVFPWTADDMSPESGQTTTVILLTTLGVEITRFSGITGTSHSIANTDFAGETDAIIRVVSERDGFTSLQGHEIEVFDIDP